MERTTTLEGRTAAEQTVTGRTRTGRGVALALQLLGAVLVVSSVFVGVFASHAGASGLSNGTVTLKTSSGSIATSPLVDNQSVDVSIGPNATLSQSSLEAAGFPSGVVAVKVLMCEDPDGQVANLPQQLSSCAPTTLIVGPGPQKNGSVSVDGFTIYVVPDPAVLGTSNGTVCDANHECVLGIFSNQENFSKPHLFSAPFEVASAGSAGTASTSPAASGSTSPAAAGTHSASGGASAGVSVPPATLANTGAPTLWPWLLGAGFVLLLVGSGLRYFRRPVHEGRS